MTTKNDRTLVHVETVEEAEDIRAKLLKLSPRPWIYVKHGPHMDGYDICIGNEYGTFPSEDFFKKIEEEYLATEIEIDEGGDEVIEITDSDIIEIS